MSINFGYKTFNLLVLAQHNDLGKDGERLARQLLESKGYQILEENWRESRAEVDLVAMDGEILVFVEVKSRSNLSFGPPEAFVTARKKKMLAHAASAYMEKIGHEWEIRFDIVAVAFAGGSPAIEHFEDAFFPGRI